MDGSVVEQIVLQIWEPVGERVQNRVPEQIMDSSVPQLMEAVVEVIPQERVQNRFPGADYGFPRASAHGGRRGSYTTGTTVAPKLLF